MRRRLIRTRWRTWRTYRWRAGLVRGEWWVGARYDFQADVWMVGALGAVLVVGRG